MKSTHHASRRERKTFRPEHPSQIREDVKAALSEVQGRMDAEAEALESAMLAAHREARLAQSVPALCLAAMACEGITARLAFQAVAVATGFHESHVQRLFYRSRALMGNTHVLLRVKKEKP